MSDILQVINPTNNRAVAHIQLGQPARTKQYRPERDFSMIAGDLWLEWFEQLPLKLEFSSGKQVPVMVSTLPNRGAGVLQFL